MLPPALPPLLPQFTRDWRLDANRRDLTVNAMFLTLDGVLVDFFGGEKDLKERNPIH